MFEKEKPKTTTDIKKKKKTGHFECKNRKTDLKNDQNRKTENSNARLLIHIATRLALLLLARSIADRSRSVDRVIWSFDRLLTASSLFFSDFMVILYCNFIVIHLKYIILKLHCH